MRTIDLNADIAEGYDDAPLVPLLTSANVCCGAHAGDLQLAEQTVKLCGLHGVSVGAHPGWPDRRHFGRQPRHDFTLAEAESLVLRQLLDLQAICAGADLPLRHVKAHGALANQAADDIQLALALGRAIRALRPDDPPRWVVMPHTQLQVAAQQLQLPTVCEAYIDRTYQPTGQLTPRSQPGAVLYDAVEAARRAVDIANRQALPLQGGLWLPTRVETLCVHGDTPQAIEMAQAVRRGLIEARFTVTPFR